LVSGVAALVADAVALAEKACGAISRLPGAPLLHADKGPDARIADRSGDVVAELHGGVGDPRQHTGTGVVIERGAMPRTVGSGEARVWRALNTIR
jgi:putative selenate reductase molybdopterin-binding subunit